MAIKKVTDLDALTAVADDDLLMVVDVSDTTDSPEGTSKKVERGDLVGTFYTVLHGSFFDSSVRDVYLPWTGESEMTIVQRWNKLPMGYNGYLKRVVIRREYTTPTSGDLALSLYRYPRNSNTPTSIERIVVTPTYGSIVQVVFDFTSAAVLEPTYSYALYLENNLNYAMGNTSFAAYLQLQ